MKNDNITRLTENDIDRVLSSELGPHFAEYRKLWYKSGRVDSPDFPIHIDFELNDKCNQSCKMCPRNEKMHPDINYELNTKAVLNFETFARIIDEGVPRGLKSVNLGAFAEPMIHKDLFKMLKYARDAGVVDTRIVTNGTLLDRHINDVFDSGLVNLFVSVDAFSEDKYREIRGSPIEKVRGGLLKFLEEKKSRGATLPIVRVSFVDMNRNSEEKQQFIDFWRDKVDFIDIQVFDNFNIDITKPYDMSKPKKWDCESPWVRMSVIANGDVLPCCSFFGRNVPVGNVMKNSMSEIWKGEGMRKVRSGVVEDSLKNCSICQRCS